MRTALEVRQSFCDTHLDTRHFRSGSVGVGSKVAWRWRFLGVDMGTVPSALRYVLPWLPPIWSECEPVETAHFQLAEDADLDTLFAHTDDGWTAEIPTGWSAFQNGRQVTGTATIDADSAITLQKGDVRFEAAIVDAPTATKRSMPDPEPPILASFGLMATTGLMFGLGVYFAPPPPQMTVMEIQERVAEVAMVIPPPEKPKPTQKAQANAGGGGPSEPVADPEPAGSKHEQDLRTVKSAGLIGALETMGGIDSDLDGIAQLTDSLVVSGGGGPAMGFGLHGRGDGLRNGGGEGEGMGEFGRPGNRLGNGNGLGPGFIKKGTGGPITITQDPVVIGSVRAEEIDRVIKRHLSQIRYCYQRQLQRSPDLGGKLVVKFTIAKDGSVSSASVKSSSIGSAAVDQCVVGRIMRMNFEAPRGGGIAIVSYPFMFSPR